MGGESKGDELRASVPADGRAGVGADWSQRIAATLDLFDVWPMTHHVECVAHLVKR